MKKRVWLITALTVFLLLLCSCGSTVPEQTEPEPIEPPAPPEEVVVSFDELLLDTVFDNSVSGYRLVFPEQTSFDTSLNKYVVTAEGKYFTCTISRERSPYKDCHPEMTAGLKIFAPDFPYEDGIDQYIGYYQSRFILNKKWQTENDVEVTDPEIFDAAGHKAYIFHAVMKDAPKGCFDGYSYVYIRTAGQYFLRLVFRYDSRNEYFRNQIKDICTSLAVYEPKGGGVTDVVYHPGIPKNWNAETAALYSRLSASTDLAWGIYSADVTAEMLGTGTDEKLKELEGKLDYKFDVLLSYIHSNMQFPSEFMEKTWNEGRIIELTYQITNNNNSDFLVDSPMLNIYRGEEEELERVRAFARAAKEFGHPFLLRICNEMNSDWTSYGGVTNMCDPEIFCEVWRILYRIFEEEGVDNCIWVFNPNDRPAPPCNWNNALCYYPGDEYVQVIGVTGYNNGTYYRKWGEIWRDFTLIYDLIEKDYGKVFGDFPWMITEFASSSYGGDKVKWINSMFDNITKYRNIKIAVWFSEADYDDNGTAARPYWLDETPQTLAAFKKGLAGFKSGLLR